MDSTLEMAPPVWLIANPELYRKHAARLSAAQGPPQPLHRAAGADASLSHAHLFGSTAVLEAAQAAARSFEAKMSPTPTPKAAFKAASRAGGKVGSKRPVKAPPRALEKREREEDVVPGGQDLVRDLGGDRGSRETKRRKLQLSEVANGVPLRRVFDLVQQFVAFFEANTVDPSLVATTPLGLEAKRFAKQTDRRVLLINGDILHVFTPFPNQGSWFYHYDNQSLKKSASASDIIFDWKAVRRLGAEHFELLVAGKLLSVVDTLPRVDDEFQSWEVRIGQTGEGIRSKKFYRGMAYGPACAARFLLTRWRIDDATIMRFLRTFGFWCEESYKAMKEAVEAQAGAEDFGCECSGEGMCVMCHAVGIGGMEYKAITRQALEDLNNIRRDWVRSLTEVLRRRQPILWEDWVREQREQLARRATVQPSGQLDRVLATRVMSSKVIKDLAIARGLPVEERDALGQELERINKLYRQEQQHSDAKHLMRLHFRADDVENGGPRRNARRLASLASIGNLAVVDVALGLHDGSRDTVENQLYRRTDLLERELCAKGTSRGPPPSEAPILREHDGPMDLEKISKVLRTNVFVRYLAFLEVRRAERGNGSASSPIAGAGAKGSRSSKAGGSRKPDPGANRISDLVKTSSEASCFGSSDSGDSQESNFERMIKLEEDGMRAAGTAPRTGGGSVVKPEEDIDEIARLLLTFSSSRKQPAVEITEGGF